MAITHSTTARNALADQIDTLINGGTGAGALVIIESAGPTDLVSITLQDPAFGAAASGQITANGLPLTGTAGASGTADQFEVRDGDGAVIFQGTVGQGSGDLSLDNTNIASGQDVTINTFTYTAPS